MLEITNFKKVIDYCNEQGVSLQAGTDEFLENSIYIQITKNNKHSRRTISTMDKISADLLLKYYVVDMIKEVS